MAWRDENTGYWYESDATGSPYVVADPNAPKVTHRGLAEPGATWQSLRDAGMYAPGLQYSYGLAEEVGLSPAQYNELLAGSGLGNMTNPFPTDRAMFDLIAGKAGLSGNPDFSAYRASLEPYWQGSGDQWATAWHEQNKGTTIADVLKGIGFVAGALSGFGAIGGESFLGALGLGGGSSGLSNVGSGLSTAADLVAKGISSGTSRGLFEIPTAAAEVVGGDTLAPASSARTVAKRRGSSSRAVAMRSPRRSASGRASTILGDYLSEDYLG